MRNHTFKGRSFTCLGRLLLCIKYFLRNNRNKVSTNEQPCTISRRQIFILSVLPCVCVCLHCWNPHLSIIIIINIIIIMKSQLLDKLHITESYDHKSWSFAFAELQNIHSWSRWFLPFLSKASSSKALCQLQTTALQKTYTTPQNLHSAHVTGGAGLRARCQMVNMVSIQTGFNRIALRLQYVNALTVHVINTDELPVSPTSSVTLKVDSEKPFGDEPIKYVCMYSIIISTLVYLTFQLN